MKGLNEKYLKELEIKDKIMREKAKIAIKLKYKNKEGIVHGNSKINKGTNRELEKLWS